VYTRKIRLKYSFSEKWSWQWDSNPQPADYKSAALPIELCQHSLKLSYKIPAFLQKLKFVKNFSNLEFLLDSLDQVKFIFNKNVKFYAWFLTKGASKMSEYTGKCPRSWLSIKKIELISPFPRSIFLKGLAADSTEFGFRSRPKVICG